MDQMFSKFIFKRLSVLFLGLVLSGSVHAGLDMKSTLKSDCVALIDQSSYPTLDDDEAGSNSSSKSIKRKSKTKRRTNRRNLSKY